MKRVFWMMLFVLIGMVSGAPTGVAETVEKPKYGGVLRVGLQRDITSLNPFFEHLGINKWVRTLSYEGLTAIDVNEKVHPQLAESWTISKDGKEYTIRLRKGVVFHNGKELDSEDVKWSYEYVMDPKNRAYSYGTLSIMSKVDAVDKYTVKLILKEPFTPLLSIALNEDAVIVPKNSIEADKTLTVAPPGTGPFQLAEWKVASQIRQVAHKRYWNKGLPYMDEILFKSVPNDDVRFLGLRAGDLDLVQEVPYQLVTDINKGKYPDIKLAVAAVAGNRMIKMNVEAPYFKDPRIRRAVAYAVDRKAYVDAVAFGYGEPAYQVNPKGHVWYLEEVRNMEMDLEKARALLAEAGHPNGFKSTLDGRQGTEAENLILQSQLKKVGIDLELRLVDFAQHRKMTLDGTYTIQISGSSIYPDIDRALHTNFHSETGPRRSRNHTGYKNPEVDKLLDRARTTAEGRERRDLYKKAMEIINFDSSQVNLAFTSRFFGFRPHVKGFSTNRTGEFSFFGGGFVYSWIDSGSGAAPAKP
jgi:peptide/nickel transport system substrate-binding protein